MHQTSTYVSICRLFLEKYRSESYHKSRAIETTYGLAQKGVEIIALPLTLILLHELGAGGQRQAASGPGSGIVAGLGCKNEESKMGCDWEGAWQGTLFLVSVCLLRI